MTFALSRRQSLKLLAVASVVLPRDAAAAFRHFPADGEWVFAAEAEGKPIGRHSIAFRRADNALLVRSDSAWATDKAFEQHIEERWEDGWLRGLISDTRYGEETWRVRASWRDDALRGYRQGNAFSISGYNIPHSLWHPDSPHVRELIDPLDAKLKIINAYPLGAQDVLVEGQARSAQGYALYGSIRAELWYDDEGALLAAMVTLPDGKPVDLRLQAVIETRPG